MLLPPHLPVTLRKKKHRKLQEGKWGEGEKKSKEGEEEKIINEIPSAHWGDNGARLDHSPHNFSDSLHRRPGIPVTIILFPNENFNTSM